MIQTKYAKLTVIGPADNPDYWLCRCDCGKEVTVRRRHVIHGHTKSCGCLLRPHGMTGTKEHRAWKNMLRRCYTPSASYYANYGGRGIRVCEQWRNSFGQFWADIGSAPSPSHSLERSNSDGDYTPDNCFWATRTEQNRNTRRNRMLTYNGETLSVAEWAERVGISAHTICQRLDACGWSIEDALTRPVANASRS